MSKLKALLIGTGFMAKEYAKVLRKLNIQFFVCSRLLHNANEFAKKEGAYQFQSFDKLEKNDISSVDFAIVAVSVQNLYEVALKLIELNCRNILLEKPGALYSSQLLKLHEYSLINKNNVRIAYNRRFFQSILELKSILLKNKPKYATFDFTEWPNQVTKSNNDNVTLSRWAIANSSHIFDSVSFLLGDFEKMSYQIFDKYILNWHKTGATFLGNGFMQNIPISYATSWITPGRWNIEIMTENARYKLSPMEKLQILKNDSIQWENLNLDYSLDYNFKPGLYKMVIHFVSIFNNNIKNDLADFEKLPSLIENYKLINVIENTVGYKSE